MYIYLYIYIILDILKLFLVALMCPYMFTIHRIYFHNFSEDKETYLI